MTDEPVINPRASAYVDEKGRWRAGNPGRPKGSRDRSALLVETMMRDETREIVKAVIEAAKKGDMVACKIILDRIAPARKGAPLHFNLPEGQTADDISVALAAVVGAMANGELTPDEAQMIGSVLELRRKAIETVELERRIAALENGNGK